MELSTVKFSSEVPADGAVESIDRFNTFSTAKAR